MNKHTEDSVLRSLRNKHDCLVVNTDDYPRSVFILKGPTRKNDLGIRTRGKIDFLVNHCKYMERTVNQYPKGL